MTLKPNLIIELIDPEKGIKVNTTIAELRDWMIGIPVHYKFVSPSVISPIENAIDATPTSGGEITRAKGDSEPIHPIGDSIDKSVSGMKIMGGPVEPGTVYLIGDSIQTSARIVGVSGGKKGGRRRENK